MRTPYSGLSAKHILLMGETLARLRQDPFDMPPIDCTLQGYAQRHMEFLYQSPPWAKEWDSIFKEKPWTFLFSFFSFCCDPISFIDQGFLYGRCHSHFSRTRQPSNNTLWVLLVGFDRNVLLVKRDTCVEKRKIKQYLANGTYYLLDYKASGL